MIDVKNAKQMRRGLLSALVLSVSLISLVAVPAGHVAMAKENGGHGNGGGNGGGHGNGNGGQSAGRSGEMHGSSHAGPNADASNGGAQTADATDGTDDGDSLSPSGLGKLNGFMHASPTALGNASPNSAIGRVSQQFRDALAAFNAANEETPSEDPNAPPADPTAGPTVEDLGGILAGATNKPVTAEQVQAIADRLAEVNDDPSLGDISDEDAQGIADAANGVETSDAGDDADTDIEP